MKGQSSYPFSMLEAALSFLIVMMVLVGSQGFILEFIKEQTVDLRGERIVNAASGLETYPEGQLEIEVEDHEFKIEGSELVLKFRDTEESFELSEKTYSQISGPGEFEEVGDDGILCIEKSVRPDSSDQLLFSSDC